MKVHLMYTNDYGMVNSLVATMTENVTISTHTHTHMYSDYKSDSGQYIKHTLTVINDNRG